MCKFEEEQVFVTLKIKKPSPLGMAFLLWFAHLHIRTLTRAVAQCFDAIV